MTNGVAGGQPAGAPDPVADPAPADAGGGNGNGAAAAPSLPDPTLWAKGIALLLLIVAVVVALLLNKSGHKPFDPVKSSQAPTGGNFGVFAGFFIGTTIIERLLELVSPLVPVWPPFWPPWGETAPADVPKKKADRGYVMLGFATLLGTCLCGGLGLYFLRTVGVMDVSKGVDIFFSGLLIAGGTKALHELIKSLEAIKSSGSTTAG